MKTTYDSIKEIVRASALSIKQLGDAFRKIDSCGISAVKDVENFRMALKRINSLNKTSSKQSVGKKR